MKDYLKATLICLIVVLTASSVRGDEADERDRALKIAYCLPAQQYRFELFCKKATPAQSCRDIQSILNRMRILVYAYASRHQSDASGDELTAAALAGRGDNQECNSIISNGLKSKDSAYGRCLEKCLGDPGSLLSCTENCSPTVCRHINTTCDNVEALLPY